MDPYYSGSVKRDSTSFDEGPDTEVRILCLNLQLYPLLRDWKEKFNFIMFQFLIPLMKKIIVSYIYICQVFVYAMNCVYPPEIQMLKP